MFAPDNERIAKPRAAGEEDAAVALEDAICAGEVALTSVLRREAELIDSITALVACMHELRSQVPYDSMDQEPSQ